MRKCKAVVFDMDGVIFDSEALVMNIWKDMGEKYHIANIEATMQKCIGVNAVETKQIFMDAYGEDFPYEVYIKEVSQIFHDKTDNGELPIKPGVEELLKYLKQEGYIVGLASSTREASVRQELTDAGLISYFQELTCGDMLKASKPKPDIYLMACEKLGVAPEDAIAIEDSYNGIRAAYSAGMRPIMVPDLIGPDAEMQEKCEKIFNNLMEVQEWIADIA